MKSLHWSVILLALLLAAMAMVPMVSAAENMTKDELLNRVATVHFIPSKEFTNYINAPPITEKQKGDAMKIASASMQNITALSASSIAATPKKFGDYVKKSHGPILIDWSYPYSGNLYLSMSVGSPSSIEYGHAYAIVDIDSGIVLSEGFTDWHKYW